REFADHGVDALVLSDSPGVMLPERVRTALTATRQAIGDLELHFHCHTTTSVGREACQEAIGAAADGIWRASRPLAWGTSVPSTLEQFLLDVNRNGHGGFP